MRGVAAIGNISMDTIAGGRPRVGGAPYHAARALRLLGRGSRIVTRSAASDRRALVVGVSVVATIGALTIDLLSYQSFLLMLGSFFVPLFGVLLADWLAAGSRYREQDVFAGPTVRWGMLAAWIAGFAAYQWLQPVGPSWWTDLLGEGADLGLGATLPSFAVSVVLGLAVATLGKRRF